MRSFYFASKYISEYNFIMKNDNKGFTNIVILIVGFVLVLLAVGMLSGNSAINKTVIDTDTTDKVLETETDDTGTAELPEGTSTCGIYFSTLNDNDTVESPLVIKGNTDGCGWSAFEGVIGNAKLFDLESGTQIGNTAILSATSEWMTTEPVYFEGTITFTDTEVENNGYVLIEHQQVADEDPILTHVIPIKY